MCVEDDGEMQSLPLMPQCSRRGVSRNHFLEYCLKKKNMWDSAGGYNSLYILSSHVLGSDGGQQATGAGHGRST